MSKGIYVGIGGVPHKVKKVFVGVDGVPRKVKKVFVGVGGLPRLTYSAEITKVASNLLLNEKKRGVCGAYNSYHALFVGGFPDSTNNNTTNVVEAFNTSLVKSIASPLSENKCNAQGLNIGEIIFIGGGNTSNQGYRSTNSVDTYDANLVMAHMYYGLNAFVFRHGAAVAGDYAIFAGGLYNDQYGDDYNKKDVTAYSSSQVRFTPASLDTERHGMGSASIGNRALFAGGYAGVSSVGTAVATCEVYDASLVKTVASPLSVAGYPEKFGGASNSNYAIITNGSGGSAIVVNTYNSQLIRGVAPDLSQPRSQVTCVGTPDQVVLAGGRYGNYGSVVVESIDTSLVKTNLADLSVARGDMARATIGDKILLAGGYDASSPYSSDAIDVYEF